MLLRVLIQLILFVVFLSGRVTAVGDDDEMFIAVVTLNSNCLYYFLKRSDTIFSFKEKIIAKGTRN